MESAVYSGSQVIQDVAAKLIVHWPPVVGVDQAEVPQFGPLIDVGHAGRRQFEQRLRQRVPNAELSDALGKWLKVRQEEIARRVVENPRDEVLKRLLIRFVGADPTRPNLGFARRLQQILLKPFDILLRIEGGIPPEGPGTNQSLIEQILGV